MYLWYRFQCNAIQFELICFNYKLLMVHYHAIKVFCACAAVGSLNAIMICQFEMCTKRHDIYFYLNMFDVIQMCLSLYRHPYISIWHWIPQIGLVKKGLYRSGQMFCIKETTKKSTGSHNSSTVFHVRFWNVTFFNFWYFFPLSI